VTSNPSPQQPVPAVPRGREHAELAELLTRKDVLAGLMFIGIAALGLWLSRNYPIGTALRMGTGYVPRLLCWVLLGLGACILFSGLRQAPSRYATAGGGSINWRPVVFVTASLVLFGLTLEGLGLVVAILLLIGVGAFASRSLRPFETLVAAVILIGLSWAIFIVGLGLTIPVWPDW
jgi:putative tricarboxylic transport membrane protein